jgi:guanine deaminase
MKIYRSALLRFADGSPLYDSDGLLATAPDAQGQERVVAAGSWQALQAQYTQREGVQVQHLPGAAGAGLCGHAHPLPADRCDRRPGRWPAALAGELHLPHESRFHDRAYADGVAEFFWTSCCATA